MKLVAELSCNHNGSLDRAIKTIQSVNADCVKFQLWTEPMAVDHQILSGKWAGYYLPSLYDQAQTPAEWLPELFRATRDAGMVPFASPFDLPAVDILEGLGCQMYKIASFEAIDLQLIEYCAQTEKPIIISTGQVELHELRAAYWAARKWTDDITLLHCVSEYPTVMQNVNLKTMEGLKTHFPDCKVGISDHSSGPLVPLVAAAMGADMIEKHVTLKRDTLDADFSLLPEEFNSMAAYCRDVGQVMGEIRFNKGGELRRSLYWADNIKAGTIIDHQHIKTARPNLGLSPLKVEKILGKKLTEDVERDQPVSLRLLR